MNADRWQRVKEGFHAALERTPDERDAFLDRVCAGDEPLRVEIARLLAAHVEAGGFIEASPVAGLAHAAGTGTIPLSGRVLGHYEVGRLLGAGGMGEVYAAHDTELGREVALKVVTGGGTPELQSALRREAQRASQLNHPNICTIHEVGAFEGQAYIVMEYVEGSPLSEEIGSEGLPLETLLRYGIHVAAALAHAHGHGIVHRDLKSANVVVTSDGRAKVLDFGLAHAVSVEPAHAIPHPRDLSAGFPPVAGTLSHMAPELLRGAAASARSDIWALGVVLYEMTSGQRPFDGDTSSALSAAILNAAPAALPARVPASLQTIIRRCLAKDPHERYAQAIEVRSALEAVQADVRSGASHARAEVGPPPRLRARRAALALVGLATVVASAFTWRWMSGPAGPVAVGASGRPAVAVMYFDNMAGTPDTEWLSQGVPSMLLTGLAQTRGLEIVSAQRLQEIVKQIGGETLDSLDRSQVPDVARRAGAGAVVVGSIFKAGDEIRIDAQLEDLSNGRVLVAESVRGTDVFALVDQLAARIRDGVGFRDAGNVRGVADVSSYSLEAYRLYSLGVDAYHNVRLDEARELLEGAVAVDPAFAASYLHLALLSDWTGRPAAQRYYLGRAADHPDRLTERQRLLMESVSARDAGNSAEAGRLLDEVLGKFPDFDDAYTTVSWLYGPLGLMPNAQKQLAIATAGAATLPASRQIRNIYGYALLEVGRYDEAVRELEAYARAAPREANPYDSLGEAHLVMGFPEKAVEYYARAQTVDPGFVMAHIGRAWGLAMLGRYDEAIAEDPPDPSVKAFVLSRTGRYREAEQVLRDGVRQAEINENVVEQGSLALLSSLLSLERRNLAAARAALRRAEERFAQLPEANRRLYLVVSHHLSGMVEVAAGRPGAARAHLDVLAKLHRPAQVAETWWARSLEGDIALSERRLDDAAATFAAAEPSARMWTQMTQTHSAILANHSPARDGAARAMKARGDLAGAIQAYRRLLRSGNQTNWTAMIEPLYVLELGRLLEQMGEKDAARLEYQRFLAFWMNADPGLPELAEARRASARLR